MPDRDVLGAVQEAFLASILSGAATPDGMRQLFRRPPAGSIASRWHVYASGFLARLVEAIENDYPALAKVLGSGALRSLVARYIRSCPPRSHDLGRFGDRLAGFLERDLLTKELPFLPDLARLEWAVAEAFVAPDVAELTWAELVRCGPEAATDMRLDLRPGAALVASMWPIHEIWSCRDEPAEAIDVALSRVPGTVLVSRRAIDIVCRPASDVDVLLFRAGAQRHRIADLLDEDGSRAGELVAAFHGLVEDGVFARPRSGSPAAGGTSMGGPRGG